MTTTANTRKPRTRAAARRRLPRLGWGWVIVAVIVVAIARTWPIWTGCVVALAAAMVIVSAIRPRRLAGLWKAIDHIREHRRALPARGRRTVAAFQAMNPTRFEHAITELTGAHPDITAAAHTGRTADRGLDVLATHDNGARILIQCKRYAGNVGSDTIREVAGSVLANGCQHGTIVTTAGYTAEAYATNQMLGRNALTLIDGHALEQWANGHHLPWR